MSQSIPEEPVFPALPRLSRRGSTPTTVASEAALWESLVGKPRGKATDPLIHATGMPRILSRTSSESIPHLEQRGGNWAPLDVAGTLVLPLEWRRVCRGTS